MTPIVNVARSATCLTVGVSVLSGRDDTIEEFVFMAVSYILPINAGLGFAYD